MATVVNVVEIWFQGGIRNGRKLEGKRAMKVFEMTGGAPFGATFLAGQRLHQKFRRPKGAKGICAGGISIPYTERYEVVERTTIGRLLKLRVKRVP